MYRGMFVSVLRTRPIPNIRWPYACEVQVALELIPILKITSIDTSLHIGLGPFYRVMNAKYRAQTSKTVSSDT